LDDQRQAVGWKTAKETRVGLRDLKLKRSGESRRERLLKLEPRRPVLIQICRGQPKNASAHNLGLSGRAVGQYLAGRRRSTAVRAHIRGVEPAYGETERLGGNLLRRENGTDHQTGHDETRTHFTAHSHFSPFARAKKRRETASHCDSVEELPGFATT
jgi:hypothetical protein